MVAAEAALEIAIVPSAATPTTASFDRMFLTTILVSLEKLVERNENR